MGMARRNFNLLLEGAAIPEPSVFAFLFGGFASVYILVRRTKNPVKIVL